MFRGLVLARIMEPASKLNSLRVLEEAGAAAASYRIGLLTGQDGFPLVVSAFEGNKAENNCRSSRSPWPPTACPTSPSTASQARPRPACRTGT